MKKKEYYFIVGTSECHLVIYDKWICSETIPPSWGGGGGLAALVSYFTFLGELIISLCEMFGVVTAEVLKTKLNLLPLNIFNFTFRLKLYFATRTSTVFKWLKITHVCLI